MSYQFIPWLKTGTGAAITLPDTLDDAPASRVELPVTLKVNDKHDAPVSVRVFGPGDVLGIDPQQVLRVEPRALTPDFEPNYFPAVEFRRADFPWMFTPATGDPKGRLRPWLCLVVVRQQDGVRLTADRNRPLPVLTISAPAVPAKELPDLADSWAWAHTQVTGGETGTALVELLKSESARTISRLLAPVRLRPSSRYYAAIVPAFEAGRRAGLGLNPGPEDEKLTPAWRSGASAPVAIDLPVYFHWEFGTGVSGDFESLVRRLEGRPVPDGVGSRDMQVSGLGFALPDLGVISFEGALRSPKAPGKPPNATKLEQFSQTLRGILNKTLPLGPAADPVVGPPVYGRFHTAVQQVPAPNTAPVWLGKLNLDPRFRGVAGLGSFVVQDQQEQLMASAWDQLGGVKSAAQRLRQATLAVEVGRSVLDRRLKNISAPQLLHMTAAIHARLRFGTQQSMAAAAAATGSESTAVVTAPTIAQKLQSSYLAASVTSGAFRKTFRTGGPLARRMEAAAPAPSEAPVAERVTARLASRPSPSVSMRISRGFATTDQIQAQLDDVRADIATGADTTPQSARFLAAGDQLRAYLGNVMPSPGSMPAPPSLSEVRTDVLRQIQPSLTVALRVRSLLPLPQQSTALASTAASTEPLEKTILPHPEFPQPMYEALRDISQEYLLPGAANVPADTVTVVKTNPEFVEAFMVGLNHEMSRELLWREYPTDQRGTYFNRFWDTGGKTVSGPQPQIQPIHMWPPAAPLGKNFMGDGFDDRLVLLIRGEVLRRYPGTVIYAVKADTFGTPQAVELYPVFRGALDPDMVFLGFNLSEDDARGGQGRPGYYFVLQEQPAEPRFGLDVPQTFGADPAQLAKWDDLTWGHVVPDAAAFEQLTWLPLAGRLAGRKVQNIEWGFNAAHMARITLQKRVRVAIHASELLPPKA